MEYSLSGWESSKQARISKASNFIINNKEDIDIKGIPSSLIRYGICVLDIDSCKNKENIFEYIAGQIGNLHTHDSKERCVWDVKVGGSDGKENLAMSHFTMEFIFHTDCCYEIDVPSYIGLFVLQSDSLGGNKYLN